MIRTASLAVLCALGGCSIPLGDNAAGPQPSPDAIAACNTRADQAFLSQNRGAIYKADRYDTSLRDAPSSSSGLPETSANLSDQYARNQDLKTCLNGEATPRSPQP